MLNDGIITAARRMVNVAALPSVSDALAVLEDLRRHFEILTWFQAAGGLGTKIP